MEGNKGFYVLESEQEFDRFLLSLLNSLGTYIMINNKEIKKEEVDGLMQTTMHNIMFLCGEYHGLVSDGKIEPVQPPKGKTKEELRAEVLKDLGIVEKFFSHKKNDTDKDDDGNE